MRCQLPYFTLALLAVLFLSSAVSAQNLPKNTNQSSSSTLRSYVAGGSGNLIRSNSKTSFIGGGQGNSVAPGSSGSFIGGGAQNKVTATNYFIGIASFPALATVAGGGENNAASPYSFVGGGYQNTASNFNSAVAGGFLNKTAGNYAFIGAGLHNRATEWAAVVAGGETNTASAAYTTISGGSNNTASAIYATVPGGARCKASNAGSFVWSGLDTVDTVSTNTNSFTVRATGGVRFITTDATNDLVIGSVFNAVNGVGVDPGGTQWKSLSDSNSKTDFKPIKPREILSKVAALPVTSWRYKHDLKRRYIGPMAQDFHAAFELGSDDKSIGTLDSDGVMYAAIQGLVQELKDRDRAMAVRDKKIEELNAKLKSFEQRLNTLPPAP